LAASCCCANSWFRFGGLEWLRDGKSHGTPMFNGGLMEPMWENHEKSFANKDPPVFNMWKTQVKKQQTIASKLQWRVPAIIRNKTRTQHINVY
jgi:hypothetical protein